MSDYLWDKQGEPDAEVARLEALLGAYAHEPRPLALPAELAAPGRQPARLLPFSTRLRASRLFAPAALVAAAALLVASVFVASLLLRARVPTGGEQVRSAPTPPAGAVKDETPSSAVAIKGGRVDKKVVEKVTVEPLPRVVRRRKEVQVAATPGRRPKPAAAETLTGGPGAGLTLEAMSTRGGASSLVENTRLLTKEQLVYALRLTGAKLRDMREKAQETQTYER